MKLPKFLAPVIKLFSRAKSEIDKNVDKAVDSLKKGLQENTIIKEDIELIAQKQIFDIDEISKNIKKQRKHIEDNFYTRKTNQVLPIIYFDKIIEIFKEFMPEALSMMSSGDPELWDKLIMNDLEKTLLEKIEKNNNKNSVDALKFLDKIEAYREKMIGLYFDEDGIDADKKYTAQFQNHHGYEYLSGGGLFSALQTSLYYYESGQKTFRIEKQLMEELLLTDVSNVDDMFLQLPFQSICIYFPYNKTIKVHNELVEQISIDQFFFDNKKHITMFYILKNSSFASHYFYFTGGDIETQILSQLEQLGYEKSKLAKKECIEVVNFILATMLYMNSSEADGMQVNPIRTAGIKTSRFPVCSLGRNIVIHKNSVKSSEPGKSIGSGFSMNIVKWTVRGHFRNQKHGEGRTQVKIIWIRPFIKGRERDNGSVVSKPGSYILK